MASAATCYGRGRVVRREGFRTWIRGAMPWHSPPRSVATLAASLPVHFPLFPEGVTLEGGACGRYGTSLSRMGVAPGFGSPDDLVPLRDGQLAGGRGVERRPWRSSRISRTSRRCSSVRLARPPVVDDQEVEPGVSRKYLAVASVCPGHGEVVEKGGAPAGKVRGTPPGRPCGPGRRRGSSCPRRSVR